MATTQHRGAADAGRQTGTARSNCFCCIAAPREEEPDTLTNTAAAIRARRRRRLCCVAPRHEEEANISQTDVASASSHLCCIASQQQQQQSEAATASPKEEATKKTNLASCICCIGRKQHEGQSRASRRHCASQGQAAAKMARPRHWFRAVRRTLTQAPYGRSIAVTDTGPESEVKVYNPSPDPEEAEAAVAAFEEPTARGFDEECSSVVCTEGFSQEEVAAVTIQAYFRGHLARRAYRALKSLVRLQAMVRGVYVRRQAEVAIHCMQALVRLQVRVRARQLLNRSKEAQLHN